MLSKRAGELLVGLFLLIWGPVAQAQDNTAFVSPTGLYSLTIAPGWTVDPSNTGASARVDAAFAPGGDVSRGSVFITLAHARESLEAEKLAFIGDTPVRNERHVTIGGLDCLTFTFSSPSGELINNSLICDVTAPDVSGPVRVGFVMSDTATPSSYDADTSIFWQFARSIRWAGGVTSEAAGGDHVETRRK